MSNILSRTVLAALKNGVEARAFSTSTILKPWDGILRKEPARLVTDREIEIAKQLKTIVSLPIGEQHTATHEFLKAELADEESPLRNPATRYRIFSNAEHGCSLDHRKEESLRIVGRSLQNFLGENSIHRHQ